MFVIRQILDAFSHSSTMVARVVMTGYLLMSGIWMWSIQNWTVLPSLAIRNHYMPSYYWVAAYMMVGLAQLWRLTDLRPRVWTALVANGAMTTLMAVNAIILASIDDPAGMAPILGFVLSAWITLRTGWTATDRMRA